MIINSLLDKLERVPVEEIETYPENPRVGNIEKIAKSLEENWLFKPIVVQVSTNYILAGNHTYRAATEILGWTHVDIVRIDVDDVKALQIVLVDNATADEGEYNDFLLAAILGEIREENEELLAGTGYDAEEVDDMLVNISVIDPDDFDDVDPEERERAARVLERLFPSGPRTAEEDLKRADRDADKLLQQADKPVVVDEPKTGFRRKAEPKPVVEEPKEYAAFRLGELRAKVPREAYEKFIDRLMYENGGELSAAGQAAAKLLGFDDEDVLPALAEGTERWL